MSRKEKNDFYHHNHIFLVLIFLVLVSCVITTDTSLQDEDNSQDIIQNDSIPLEEFLPEDCNLIEPISTFRTVHRYNFKNSKEKKKRDIYYDNNKILIRVGSRSAACPAFYTEMGISNDSLFIVTKISTHMWAILTNNYKVEYSIIEKDKINTIKIFGIDSDSDTLTYSLDTIPEVESISSIIDSLEENSL